MNGDNPRSTARIMGHPIHPMLIPFPIVFFISAFVTDLLFVRTGESIWAEVSIWLLGAGVATAALAALAGLTDFLGDHRIRALRDAWLHMIGNVLAVVIEVVNLLLRLGDPNVAASTGVILSGLVVAILAFTGWKGGELVFRYRVGVRVGEADRQAR
jgi:uncharacterized membrane protein